MDDQDENGIEIEIREHSDADFFPKKCPNCHSRKLKRHIYHSREIQELGTPRICRRVHYERVYFQCNDCENVFTIEHPLIPVGSRYMPGVIEYAVTRVLKKGDSVRRVAQDLAELHLVKVSKSTVQRWVNEYGKRDNIISDLSEEDPPDEFSRFLFLDGTFKSVKVKKTTTIWDSKIMFTPCK